MKRRLAMLLTLLGVTQHLSAQQKQDLTTAGMQAGPPAGAAAGLKVMGAPLSEWLVILSILFIILQGAQLIWKWRRDYLHEEQRNRATGSRRACDHKDCPNPSGVAESEGG